VKQDEFHAMIERARLREAHETLPVTKEEWERERAHQQDYVAANIAAVVIGVALGGTVAGPGGALVCVLVGLVIARLSWR
jgi:hypothetical protein